MAPGTPLWILPFLTFPKRSLCWSIESNGMMLCIQSLGQEWSSWRKISTGETGKDSTIAVKESTTKYDAVRIKVYTDTLRHRRKTRGNCWWTAFYVVSDFGIKLTHRLKARDTRMHSIHKNQTVAKLQSQTNAFSEHQIQAILNTESCTENEDHRDSAETGRSTAFTVACCAQCAEANVWSSETRSHNEHCSWPSFWAVLGANDLKVASCLLLQVQ